MNIEEMVVGSAFTLRNANNDFPIPFKVLTKQLFGKN